VDEVYGSALYEAALSLGKTGELMDAVKTVRDVFREYPDFFMLLRTPSIARDERKAIVEEALGGRVPTELLNFIYVLMDKRRIGQFEGITKAFEKRADAEEGVTKGRLESATELSEDQIARFEEKTGKLLRKRVKLVSEVNARLIGGVRIYIDGKLIDASVRSKLDEMKDIVRKR
jgi:ATP synthase F1 delta subunit